MAGIKINALPAVPSAQLTDVFPVDQGASTYKESNQQLLSLFQANGAALTRINDTNVTMSLGGSPLTSLLNATSLTLGWTGQLSVPRGGTGNSTFTAYSVICAGTTATGAFQNVSGLGVAGEQLTSNGPGLLPTWQTGTAVTPSALSKTDDTNVTLTLGGTPLTALLQATSLTLGWAGQLSLARGGTNKNITPDNGALVYCDSDSLELLAATATAGQIPRSGANSAPTWSTATYPAAAGSSGNVLTSDGTNWNSSAPVSVSPLTTKGDLYTFTTVNARLAVGSTNGQMLQVNSGAATGLAWSTATYPATATNAARILRSDGTNWAETTSTFADTYGASGILYANGANNVAGLATANNGILVTSAGGVPSIGNTVGAGLTMPSITFNTTTGVVGTTTNDNAAAGSVGELVSSVIAFASAASLTTNTATNLTSISLTAGDWDVWGNVGFNGNAATTFSTGEGWVSSTSATVPDVSLIATRPYTAGSTIFSTDIVAFSVPERRFSLSGTTTIYLGVFSVFAVNTCVAFGGIYARRVR